MCGRQSRSHTPQLPIFREDTKNPDGAWAWPGVGELRRCSAHTDGLSAYNSSCALSYGDCPNCDVDPDADNHANPHFYVDTDQHAQPDTDIVQHTGTQQHGGTDPRSDAYRYRGAHQHGGAHKYGEADRVGEADQQLDS